MIYTIKQTEQKVGKTGKSYIQATIEDLNGQNYKVTSFDALVEGKQVDGVITQNGDYLNFKVGQPVQPKGNAVQAERLMDKKADTIENFQEKKQDSIARSQAVREGTNLVIAFKDAIFPDYKPTEMELRHVLLQYISWYEGIMYGEIKIPPKPAFLSSKERDHVAHAEDFNTGAVPTADIPF